MKAITLENYKGQDFNATILEVSNTKTGYGHWTANVSGLSDRLPALALWVAATFAKPLLAEGTGKLRQN